MGLMPHSMRMATTCFRYLLNSRRNSSAPTDCLTAGESHGPCLTAIVEGVPAGLKISESQINTDLSRRQSGYGRGGRQRIERDTVEVVSGVRFGRTLGTPIALVVRNRDWENWTDRMATFGEAPSDLAVRSRHAPATPTSWGRSKPTRPTAATSSSARAPARRLRAWRRPASRASSWPTWVWRCSRTSRPSEARVLQRGRRAHERSRLQAAGYRRARCAVPTTGDGGVAFDRAKDAGEFLADRGRGRCSYVTPSAAIELTSGRLRASNAPTSRPRVRPIPEQATL